ncbi:N-acetylmuramic acid 6-phosphate etherase [Phaeocystidibacter luteus]|uniref:N-acetylmuramic acid 6-phosphate etherase n=1 Tax=Phaeocystidibacter luteus TaxID=911197 RepID=A0A6N6RL24_9FLAO|nr:N-acetylmuramic acid 6-phosphate etherase [Phaeocystidibacter luteus]KAB2814357.1 N-acetylmuramic acid 6-phosphate etherase [Phaeocystidibacter luteus]
MFKRITEQPSHYNDLEQQSTRDLLTWINQEDRKVPEAIEPIIPQISEFVDEVHLRMMKGGRLFYIGAGTSGRLGVVDASECPPTFGVPHGWVVGLIAGGDGAMRKAVEFAEDSENQAWKDLSEHEIGENDTLVGIAASGTTPYVIGGLQKAREKNILTACITCNPGAPVTEVCDHPLVAVTGPEFVTGSTRMKAGTAQKLILNMISTSVMIKLGRVAGNRMVDMQLSNNKLVDRGTRMVMESTHVDYETANAALQKHGSVRSAIEALS